MVAGWVLSTGTVVDFHDYHGRTGDHTYDPIVSFTDSAGVDHRFTAPTTETQPTIGESVSVDYDPRDPTQAHDLSDRSTWLEAFVLS